MTAWSLPENPTMVEKTPLRPVPEMSALFESVAGGSDQNIHRVAAAQPPVPGFVTVRFPVMLKVPVRMGAACELAQNSAARIRVAKRIRRMICVPSDKCLNSRGMPPIQARDYRIECARPRCGCQA